MNKSLSEVTKAADDCQLQVSRDNSLTVGEDSVTAQIDRIVLQLQQEIEIEERYNQLSTRPRTGKTYRMKQIAETIMTLIS